MARVGPTAFQRVRFASSSGFSVASSELDFARDNGAPCHRVPCSAARSFYLSLTSRTLFISASSLGTCRSSRYRPGDPLQNCTCLLKKGNHNVYPNIFSSFQSPLSDLSSSVTAPQHLCLLPIFYPVLCITFTSSLCLALAFSLPYSSVSVFLCLSLSVSYLLLSITV